MPELAPVAIGPSPSGAPLRFIEGAAFILPDQVAGVRLPAGTDRAADGEGRPPETTFLPFLIAAASESPGRTSQTLSRRWARPTPGQHGLPSRGRRWPPGRRPASGPARAGGRDRPSGRRRWFPRRETASAAVRRGAGPTGMMMMMMTTGLQAMTGGVYALANDPRGNQFRKSEGYRGRKIQIS
jgi:hypothetical protein